ncbi:hypothetical protein [Burkholderia singularis]|uniref:hypothetical protein n=1 Tax=Burkholderia singularis TaxID=1503053 RepID=UPI000F7A1C52|nr:hypothetical protein [Burkholderia singularis]
MIQREYGCSLDEAVEKSVALYATIMGLFVRLKDEVAKSASPQLKNYLVNLGHYCRCGIDWVIRSARYAHPSTEREVWRVRTTEVCPVDLDVLTLPPIPSIAWWWNYDPATLRPG